MSIGVCVTTRHRPELLEECLRRIAASTLVPSEVVVSDDSSLPEMIEATKRTVAAFPFAKYVVGPHKGVCANRNYALSRLARVDYVAFLDDDALVTPAYFAVAQATFDALPPDRRDRAIVNGDRTDLDGCQTGGRVKLNFRGYFVVSDKPEVAGASHAVYPRTFFDRHVWDELIYFGYEDAELSLRALKDGYEIVHADKMIVTDAGHGKSTLVGGDDRVDAYNFAGEAARLYVGVKRFKNLEPDAPKLAAFLALYFAQCTWSLSKRRSLNRLPELVRLSNVTSLLWRT
jgi:GT2 family glycosyltransferase